MQLCCSCAVFAHDNRSVPGACVEKATALRKLHRCLNAMTSLRSIRVTAPNTPAADGLVEAALSINRLTCIKLMSANLDVRRLPEMEKMLKPQFQAIQALQLGLSNHTFTLPAAERVPSAGLPTGTGPVLCGFPKASDDERWDPKLSCSILEQMVALRELILLQWPPWQWRDALAVTQAVSPALTKLDLFIPFPDVPHLKHLSRLQHLRLTVGGGGGKGWLVQAATRGGQRGRRRHTDLPPAELGESCSRLCHQDRFGDISDWPFAQHLRTLRLQIANGFMTKAAVRASASPDSPKLNGRQPNIKDNDLMNLDDPNSPRNNQIELDQPTLGYRVASQLSCLTRLSELHLSGLPKYAPTTRAPSQDFSIALCISLSAMPQLQHLVIAPQCLPQCLNAALQRAENLTHLDLALQHSADPSLPALAELEHLVVRPHQL